MIDKYPDIFSKIADFLKTRDDFLVTPHFAPDGDAIASSLGMAEMLKAMGKRCLVSIEAGLPEKYDFLKTGVRIFNPKTEESENKFRNAIILDAGSFERIGLTKKLLDVEINILNIDHHLSNDRFGHVNYIDGEACSTSEILYYLARYLKLDFTKELADYLYMGIMTDTGCFRFSNTSGRALRAAAELVDLGVNPSYMADCIYFDAPKQYISVLAKCLSSLQYFSEGRIALMQYMEKEEIEDAEGLIDIAIGTRGVRAAAFIRPMEDGRFKVSLRARDRIDVRAIAEQYGGGGHAKAAGFRYRGTLTELQERIIRELSEKLDA